MKEASEIASELKERAAHWYLSDMKTGTETTVYSRSFNTLVDIVDSIGYHDDIEDIAAHKFLRDLAELIDYPVAKNIAADASTFKCGNCYAAFNKGMAHFNYCPHCGARIK